MHNNYCYIECFAVCKLVAMTLIIVCNFYAHNVYLCIQMYTIFGAPFTFRYSYGFMFVMDYVCMYISGNSRWRRSRSTLYKARNHLCSHFAVYSSNEIRTWVCFYTVTLVRSLLKDSHGRYSSKYHEDRATGVLKWLRSETSRYRLTTFQLFLLRSTFKWGKRA